MKNIPTALLTKLGTRQGLEPIVILKITWDTDDIVYYSQVPYTGVAVSETILSLESINFRGRFDTNTMVSSFNVTLDDSLGLHEARLRTTCYEKKKASLLIGFSDLQLSDFVEAFFGVISGSVVHSSSEQTISLNLETRVEDSIMGYNNYPMCFGSPKKVRPYTQTDIEPVALTQDFNGDGYLHTTHDWLFIDRIGSSPRLITIHGKDYYGKPCDVDFYISNDDNNNLFVTGTNSGSEYKNTIWGLQDTYYKYIHSNVPRSFVRELGLVAVEGRSDQLRVVNTELYSMGASLAVLQGKWVRVGLRFSGNLVINGVSRPNGYREAYTPNFIGSVYNEFGEYKPIANSNVSTDVTMINKCTKVEDDVLTFELPFLAMFADSNLVARDQDTWEPNALTEYCQELSGTWITILYRMGLPIGQKDNLLFNYLKHPPERNRWLKRYTNNGRIWSYAGEYMPVNNYKLKKGDLITGYTISPKRYIINCDTYTNKGENTHKSVKVYNLGVPLKEGIDYTLYTNSVKEVVYQEGKELEAETHRYLEIKPNNRSLIDYFGSSDSSIECDIESKVSDMSSAYTTAPQVIKWAINKYKVLNTVLTDHSVEVDQTTFNLVEQRLKVLKVFTNFYVSSGKNVLDFIREVAWQSMCAVNFNVGTAYIVFLPDCKISDINSFNHTGMLYRSIVKSYTPIESIATVVKGRWGVTALEQYGSGGGLTYEYTSTENDKDRKKYGAISMDLELYTLTDIKSVERVTKFWGIRYSIPWRLIQFKTDLRGIVLDINDSIEINSSRLSTNPITGTITNISIDMEQCEVTVDVQLASRDGTSAQPIEHSDYWIRKTISDDPEEPVTPPPPVEDTNSITNLKLFSDADCVVLDYHTTGVSREAILDEDALTIGSEYTSESNYDTAFDVNCYRVYTGATFTYTNTSDDSKDIKVTLEIPVLGLSNMPQYYTTFSVPANSTVTKDIGYVIRFNTLGNWANKTVQFIWSMAGNSIASKHVTFYVETPIEETPVDRNYTDAIKRIYQEVVTYDPDVDFEELDDLFDLKPINAKDFTKPLGSPNVQRSTNPLLLPNYCTSTIEYPSDWLAGVLGISAASGSIAFGTPKRCKRLIWGGGSLTNYIRPEVEGVKDETYFWWLPYYIAVAGEDGFLSGWVVFGDTSVPFFDYTSEYTTNKVVTIPFDPDENELPQVEWPNSGIEPGTFIPQSEPDTKPHGKGGIPFESGFTFANRLHGRNFTWFHVLGNEWSAPTSSATYEYKRISRLGILINDVTKVSLATVINFTLKTTAADPTLYKPIVKITYAKPSMWDEVNYGEVLSYSGYQVALREPLTKAVALGSQLFVWFLSSEEVTEDAICIDFEIVDNGTVLLFKDEADITQFQQYDWSPNESEGLSVRNISSTNIPDYAPCVLLPGRTVDLMGSNFFSVQPCTESNFDAHNVYFTKRGILAGALGRVFSAKEGDCKVLMDSSDLGSYHLPTYLPGRPYCEVGTVANQWYLGVPGQGFMVTRKEDPYIWVALNKEYESLEPVPSGEFPYLDPGVICHAEEALESNRIVKINDTPLVVDGVLYSVSYPGNQSNIPNNKLLVTTSKAVKGGTVLCKTIGMYPYSRMVVAKNKMVHGYGWADYVECTYTPDGMLTTSLTMGCTIYHVLNLYWKDGVDLAQGRVGIEPYAIGNLVAFSTKYIHDDGVLNLKVRRERFGLYTNAAKTVTIQSKNAKIRVNQMDDFSNIVTTDSSLLEKIYIDTTGLSRNNTVTLYINDIKLSPTYLEDPEPIDPNNPAEYEVLEHLADVEVVDGDVTLLSVPYKEGNSYYRDKRTTTTTAVEKYVNGAWTTVDKAPVYSIYEVLQQMTVQGKPIQEEFLNV